MNSPDPNVLQPVVYAETEFSAQTKAAVLQAEGIEAFVFANVRNTAGVFAMGGEVMRGVPVWVRHADAERARQILARRIADSVDLDWEGVDIGQPDDDTRSDQSLRTPILAQIGIALAVTMLAIALLAAVMAFLS